MLVSYNFLKELIVDFDISYQELVKVFSNLGYSVEDIKFNAKDIDKVVVAKVVDIYKHPDADRLNITKADIGKEQLIQVVTAAKNIKIGDKVPLALVGAKLYPDIKIKKAKLRGQYSYGMYCSAKELSLDITSLDKQQQEGVLILPSDVPIGEDVLTYYGIKDIIFDLETPANRPDILGIYYLAREVAFKLNKQLFDINIGFEKIPKDIADYIKVNVLNFDDCPRYTARVIENVKVKSSDLKLQIKLLLHNINPINNIVDATNYSLLLFSQPLHAFDYNKIKGKEINIRKAKEGEKILALDGKEYKLTQQDLVISDIKEPIAIAGIIGGENTKVDNNTTTIVLESAKFNQALVRKTAKRLGLRTDSSIRFEKNVSYKLIDKGAEFSISLMGDVKVLDTYIDLKKDNLKDTIYINLSKEKIRKYLNMDFSLDYLKNFFNKLGYNFQLKDEDKLSIIPPKERIDLNEDVDIIEELIRLYGYDKVQAQLPYIKMNHAKIDRQENFIYILKELSKSLGFYELITYPLLDENYLLNFNLSKDSFIYVENPLTIDFAILRPCIIPSLLKVVKYNFNNFNKDLALFTIDKVFKKDADNNFSEQLKLGFVMTGKFNLKPVSLFTIKSILYILDKLNINYYIDKSDISYLNLNESFNIYAGDNKLGFAGSLNYSIADKLDIKEKVYIANLRVDLLQQLYKDKKVVFKPLPKYPAITRDLAFVLPYNMYAGEVVKFIRNLNINILENIFILDVYIGKPLDEDKKSVTYRLSFRSSKYTLKDKEVDKIIQDIIEKIKINIGVVLR